MSDPDIDVAYNARNTVSVAEFEAIMRRYRSQSEQAVANLTGTAEIAFDPHSAERLDLWGTSQGVRPVVVAIHGGYWRALSRHDTAFMAGTLAAEGIATATIDYTLAPAATLEDMVRQVRSAIAWLCRHGREVGVDPNRIYVVGSSAGGHLAAMTAVGGWQDAFGVPYDVVKGAMAVSGLFDIRPLVSSFANEWLSLDDHRAAALSPALNPAGNAPLSFVVAEHEASGFHRQSQDFSRQWRSHSPAQLQVIAERNHFDVFLELADAQSTTSQALLDLVIAAA